MDDDGSLNLDHLTLQGEATRFINLASRFLGTYAPVAQPVMWFDGPRFVMEMLTAELRPLLQGLQWPSRPYHYVNEIPLSEHPSGQALVLYELWQREETMNAVLTAGHPFNFIYGNAWGRIAPRLRGRKDFNTTVFLPQSPLQPIGAPTIVPTRARLEQAFGRPLTEAEVNECTSCINLAGFQECWEQDIIGTSLAEPMVPVQLLIPSSELSWEQLATFLLNQYNDRFVKSMGLDEAQPGSAVQ